MQISQAHTGQSTTLSHDDMNIAPDERWKCPLLPLVGASLVAGDRRAGGALIPKTVPVHRAHLVVTLPRVTYDLYFWPSGVAEDPGRLADRLADEKADGLASDRRVLAFRTELLRRWPELADMIAPWHHDLDWRQPWGRADLADRFVVLTLPYNWAGTSALPALAGAYEVDAYDPQSEQLPSSRLLPAGSGVHDDVSQVAGWVAEDHVVRLLRQISAYIDYRYDDLDEAALTGALDDTNDEAPDGWFEYPLAGTPVLVIRLARSPGSMAVSVRVDGAMDLVLATRIETLIDLM
jgi:hypothetical protein